MRFYNKMIIEEEKSLYTLDPSFGTLNSHCSFTSNTKVTIFELCHYYKKCDAYFLIKKYFQPEAVYFQMHKIITVVISSNN